MMLEIAWTYATHQAVFDGTFLVDGNDCFVGGKDTRLVSLNTSDGEERWSVRVNNIWGWLAATPKCVFYLNQHSNLVAFDRANGKTLWSRNLRGGIYGWLHAFEERVIVGGWRGYTDILAMNAFDGSDCWVHSARGKELHSTRVHADSASLVLADPQERGALVFLSLDEGKELARFVVDTQWDGEHVGHLPGIRNAEMPLILESGGDGFFIIEGRKPKLQRITVPTSIWSRNLCCVGTVVPFITDKRELSAWSIPESRLLDFGRVEWERRDYLPFCQFTDTSIYAVGMTFGRMGVFSRLGAHPIWQRVGKRISTQLSISSSLIILGTDSGQVLGMRVRTDGQKD